MREPIVKGVSLLSLILGLGWQEARAQVGDSGFGRPGPGLSAPRSNPSGPAPGVGARGLVPGMGPNPFRAAAPPDDVGAPGPIGSGVRQVRMLQEGTPTPNQFAPPGTGPAPSAPGTTTEPTSPNPSEITLPRSERAGGGGEPTEATAAAEEAPAEEKKEEPEAPAPDETKLLMNALGIQESPVKFYGWIQNSFTGNTNGTPKNSLNFGVNPNFLANRWMGNQYYLIIENPLEQNDRINFGFRVDNLFGNDWQFNHMRGLFEHSFRVNHFLGYDPAQIYGEVHLPYLTRGGIDVKGGRFYTILGYEVVPATGRPLLSVPYMFNYGQPFTHFGMLSTLHLTDRVNVLNGAVNGWDRWINDHYKWNYLGGVTWTSKSGKAALAVSYIWGPNQYPRFLSGTNQQVFLPGNTIPPHEDGRRNLGYGSNNRLSFTEVLTYKWTDKLTQVVESDQSFENNIPGSGGIPQPGGTFVGGTDRNDSWYSFGNWFLYTFTEKLTGVWRSEVFRDDGGQRTGFRDNFYEMTLGLIWKPKPYIWIRPEARYDWAQFTHPYNDGTRNSQLTLAIDAILLY
ncbi:MAG TPA: outer membrane beta-barrel protein [Isosphaeraceae bacterium]|nr:outer membrane beta-barrel protein [Isosphaeraceae bacterium]